ncbi:MAG: non-homologous end-joining DNA ligase [Acidimicrobiales bacterium]
MKFPVAPMKAAIGQLPHDDDQWAFEIKWDGYRTIVFVDVDARTVRVQSSSGLDVSRTYGELGGMWRDLNARSAVLDGEIVVFTDDGRPSFEALQRHDTQVVFQAFDVLEIDGTDVTALPYEQRRALLADVLDAGDNWTVPGHRIGGGAELLEATAAQGLEGVMAKKLGSPYQVGKRSPHWRKVKNRVPVEVAIGGFTRGTGNRSNTFGALLVGREDDDGVLRFAGGVGTGFTQRRLEELLARMRALVTDDCPFTPVPPREYSRDATWVRPQLRARIEITEFTNEGYVRHASFVELAAG